MWSSASRCWSRAAGSPLRRHPRRTSCCPTCRCATSPSGSSPPGSRRRRRPGPLRRVDRDRAGQPARGAADDSVRGAADLGEGARRGADPDRLGDLAQARVQPVLAAGGRRDRRDPGAHRRPAHRRYAGALRDRLGLLLPGAAGPDRHAQGPLRGVGCRADRARGAAVLHGHRGADARGVRDDREHRDRHRATGRAG